MKNFLILVLLIFASTTALSEDLNTTRLIGDWMIFEFMDEPDEDGMYWRFTETTFEQCYKVKCLSPDKYTVTGNKLKMDYGSISVLELTNEELTATMAGFKYKLRKIDKQP